MVPLRHAINAALRRTTGYQLSRATEPAEATNNRPRQQSFPELAAQMGYQLHDLGRAIVATRPGRRPKHDMVVSAVDDSTWVLQQGGGNRRELVQIGADSLRTHLLMHKRSARTDMAALQRQAGSYLAHEQVAWALRKLKINCVLDVGANVGQYALRLRQHGYRGRIVSFEPVQTLAAQLRERASQDEDWLVFDCALADEDGTSEINAVPGTMSSLLTSSEFGRSWSSQLNDVHTETISLSRLDSLYDQVTDGIESPRVYLKMDTQGYDVQAFRGAGSHVDDILALQSEVACVPIYDGMARLPEILSVYEEAGFEIAGMYPVTFHKQTLRVIEFDMIMVRADAVERGLDPGS
jgi:FkbM family methyltransferase